MLTQSLKKARNTLIAMQLPPIVREVKRQQLTYLSGQKFLSLRNVIRKLKKQSVPGDFVEYGIALGGSAIYIASEIDGERRFQGFDIFGMIPAPTERDDEKAIARYEIIRSGLSMGIGTGAYYGYESNLFDKVCDAFNSFGYPVDGKSVILRRGFFDETVVFSKNERIALAHIDCDWYEPIKLCLERTAKNLSLFGCMILDDYNDYKGCRDAAQDFIKKHPEFAIIRVNPHAIIQRYR